VRRDPRWTTLGRVRSRSLREPLCRPDMASSSFRTRWTSPRIDSASQCTVRLAAQSDSVAVCEPSPETGFRKPEVIRGSEEPHRARDRRQPRPGGPCSSRSPLDRGATKVYAARSRRRLDVGGRREGVRTGGAPCSSTSPSRSRSPMPRPWPAMSDLLISNAGITCQAPDPPRRAGRRRLPPARMEVNYFFGTMNLGAGVSPSSLRGRQGGDPAHPLGRCYSPPLPPPGARPGVTAPSKACDLSCSVRSVRGGAARKDGVGGDCVAPRLDRHGDGIGGSRERRPHLLRSPNAPSTATWPEREVVWPDRFLPTSVRGQGGEPNASTS